jgi:hypothetical protein
VSGTGAGVSGGAALGGAALALRSSSTVGPGISGLFLLGSLGSSSPPINWRRVEDEAEFACSQVTTAERLLHETLVSVHWKILHPVQVSLRRDWVLLGFQ